MTADRLRDAADRLDDLISQSSPYPWVAATHPETGPYIASTEDVVASQFGNRADADLIVLLRHAAPHISQWLRNTADEWAHGPVEQAAVALAYADILNGDDAP